MSKHCYEEVTRDIRIAVEPDFLEDQSEPEENRYLWSYRVVIENKSQTPVQLLSRYWRITDARGRIREVRGEGVIGEQPVIAPGRAYEYTSGAPLETASGFMTGTYRMRASTGESFEVGIPMFALESPYEPREMH
ncbi:MAG TPA: Co2+/Mg2+ efflux protein ApaG [Micropepsaceae bacterium]|nr:Co2+/Mg2+ efflux protein ApaG [Micropepsaceae bacterium]